MMKKCVLGLFLLGAVVASARNAKYVDLGLSVLWSTENSGISDKLPLGEYLTWTDAVQHYGNGNEKGRLASKSEWDELQEFCTWEWTTIDGNPGYMVTSKVKGFTDNSIFLPAAGWLQNGKIEQSSTHAAYWSATEGVQPNNSAAYGFNYKRGHKEWHSENRFSEQSVRLVRPLDKDQIKKISIEHEKLTMRQGTSGRLAVSMQNGKRNVNSVCTWTSSDGNVVSVSADGLMVAHNPGKCTITATAYGNSAVCSVTVTQDEYTYVDLGLSVFWATHNLGARDSSDNGYYYAWAEVEPKETFSWANYRFCSFAGQSNGLDKYVQNGMEHQYLPADNLTRLLPEDDAATLLLGSDWHIPTQSEFEELNENCDIRDTVTTDGVAGALIISAVPGYEGRSIFIPFSGKFDGNEPIGVGEEFMLWGADTEGYIGGYRFADEWKALRTGGFRYGVDRFYGLNIRPVRCMTEEQFSSIGIKGDLTDMSYGEVRHVDLTMEPSGKSIIPNTIIWKSSDESVAQAMPDGTIIALGTGECTLTAQYGGKSIIVPVSVTISVPQPVDLGLSVKWASANLGAAVPEDNGGMFAWGETSVKILPYSRDNYKFLETTNSEFSKYFFGEKYSDNKNMDFKEQLDPEDDAAHVLLGGQWRMPTATECDELVKNCTWTEIDDGNRVGWLVTSLVPGYEGNSIFIPYTLSMSRIRIAGLDEFAYSRNSFSYSTSTLDVTMGIGSLEYSSMPATRIEGGPIRPVLELTAQESTVRETEILERTSKNVVGNVKHEYIDLGLSVKWATMNVGALTPEDNGNGFAWGETAPKPYYSLYNYSLASFREDLGYWGYDNTPDRVLELNQDAAHVNWGGDWRLPTKQEYQELENKCEWTDTIQNGLRGFLVTSKMPGYEGSSIFLPFKQSLEDNDFIGTSRDVVYMSSSSSSRQFSEGDAVVLYLTTNICGTIDEFKENSFDEYTKIHISQRKPYESFLIRPVR